VGAVGGRGVILESDKLMVIQTLGGRMAYLGCSVLHAAIAPNHHSTGHSGTTAWKGPPLFHLGCGSGPSSWTLGLPATSVPHFAYLVASRTPLRRCLLPPTGLCAWRYMGQVWPDHGHVRPLTHLTWHSAHMQGFVSHSCCSSTFSWVSCALTVAFTPKCSSGR
jgi:hypothetical protein